MVNLRFLDPEETIKENYRGSLEQSHKLILQADYSAANGILKNLINDTNDHVRAFAYTDIGDIFHFQWNFQQALDNYDQALKIFNQLGQTHARGRIFATYRTADVSIDAIDNELVRTSEEENAERRNRMQEYMAMFNTALQEAEGLGDEFLIAFGHHYKGIFYLIDYNYRQALGEFQKAIDIRRRIGDQDYVYSSEALLARCLALDGDYSKAKEIAESAYSSQMSLGLKGSALRTLTIISYITAKENQSAMDKLSSEFTNADAPSVYLDSLGSFNRDYIQPTISDKIRSKMDLMS